jgi:hypothetical protein
MLFKSHIVGKMTIQFFAEEVARSAPELYPDGAISVLKQFEKLQSAQKEITKCQVKKIAGNSTKVVY